MVTTVRSVGLTFDLLNPSLILAAWRTVLRPSIMPTGQRPSPAIPSQTRRTLQINSFEGSSGLENALELVLKDIGWTLLGCVGSDAVAQEYRSPYMGMSGGIGWQKMMRVTAASAEVRRYFILKHPSLTLVVIGPQLHCRARPRIAITAVQHLSKARSDVNKYFMGRNIKHRHKIDMPNRCCERRYINQWSGRAQATPHASDSSFDISLKFLWLNPTHLHLTPIAYAQRHVSPKSMGQVNLRKQRNIVPRRLGTREIQYHICRQCSDKWLPPQCRWSQETSRWPRSRIIHIGPKPNETGTFNPLSERTV